MSYNIDSISYIGGGRLTVIPDRLIDAMKAVDDRAECNFIEEMEHIILSASNDRKIVPDTGMWVGEGSGSTFKSFLRALMFTRGCADLLLTWEGGDHTGLRVVSGVVTEHRVRFVLGDKV